MCALVYAGHIDGVNTMACLYVMHSDRRQRKRGSLCALSLALVMKATAVLTPGGG